MISDKELLCFDDVLLRPSFSDIESRSLVDTSTEIAGIKFNIPFVSANMDSVTEEDMAQEMWQQGGLGILHRYNNIDRIVSQIRFLKSWNALATSFT